VIDLLWVVWDGASFDVVQRLLDGGDLPTLARVSGGRVVPVAPLAPNCQTPPSLASLFTGGSTAEHRVTGFRMPASGPGASFVDSRSGFERSGMRLPLLWDRLAAHGMRPGLSHVPWTADSGDEKVVVEAFEHPVARPGLVELANGTVLDLGGRQVTLREVDGGRYEARSERSGAPVRLTPGPELRFAREPLRLGPGLATHLAVLAVDDLRILVHTGLWELRARPAQLQAALDARVGAFVGKALGDAYHLDRFGPRGTPGASAEDALFRSAELQMECFTRCAETLLDSGLARGAVISYHPTLDELQHEVFRWHAEGSARSELLRRAYRMADEHLARLVARRGPDARVVVSSDHGAAVLRRHYHPNQTLARAGLLRFDERGRVVPAASQVAFHPAANGSVWVNGTDRAGGIVTDDRRGPLLDAAEAALRAARDPATGQPPVAVRRVPAGERDLFGDLYLSVRTGYECDSRAGPGGEELADAAEGGTHVAPTGESTLRGMLATAGGDATEGMTLMDVHDLVAGLVEARRRGPALS
jgi:hypothetical protein